MITAYSVKTARGSVRTRATPLVRFSGWIWPSIADMSRRAKIRPNPRLPQ